MLRTFQKYRRSILGIVAVGLVGLAMSGFGIDMIQRSNEPYAIKIDDHTISFTEFEQEKRNIEERYRQMFGQNWAQFSETIRTNLGSQARDSLISDFLLRREAKKVGLFAGDEAVRTLIRTELFPQGFNPDQYSSFLRMRGMTSSAFEAELRNYALRSQLASLIEDTSVVSRRETKAALIRQQTSYDVSYLEFDPAAYMNETLAPSDAEIDQYYNENSSEFELPARVSYDYTALNPKNFLSLVEVTPDDIEIHYSENEVKYQTPEEIKVRHIQFNVPSSADAAQIVAIKEKAREVRAKAVGAPAAPSAASNSAAAAAPSEPISSGQTEDFAALASSHSEDITTSLSGGDLGWIARGKMDKSFDAAAFKLKPGEISDIVEAPYGFHIIKVEDRRAPRQKPLDEVRSEIIKEIQEREAPAFTRAKAEDLLTEWQKVPTDLAAFANQHNLTAASTVSLFDSSKSPEGLPGLTELVLANADQSKQLLDLGDSSVLVQVREYKEPEIAALSQVKERIVATLKERAARELAKSKAQTFLTQAQEAAKSAAANAPKDDKATAQRLDQLAKKAGLTPKESKAMTSAQLAGVFLNQELLSAIAATTHPFAAPTQLYEQDKKYIIFQVTSIKKPNEAEIADKIQQQLESERSQSAQLLMASLVSMLKSSSQIDVNAAILGDG